MTKKDIVKFLEKYNDDDDLCIVLDEDKENNFVYTSKEKDMLGVYKEVIRFLSEHKITFDIMALCEMICSDNIDSLYSLGYVNVNHVIKDNKLHFRISSKDLEENDKLEDVLFDYQDGMGIYQRTQWEDSYYGYLLLPLDTGLRMDRFFCVYFTC